MRAIVSVATGPHYVANQDRLYRQIPTGTQCFFFRDELPPYSPTHAENPYAFKIFAIEYAAYRSATSILWMDSSIVVLRSLEPLWDLIEQQSYWFSRNYDYNLAQFCSDEALSILGEARAFAKQIPLVVAGCFGLDMRNGEAQAFLAEWKRFAEEGAFRGDRGDLSGGTDPDKFYGHRNDQACASQVVHALGLKLTSPPDYFAEQGAPQNERTILTVER